MSLSFCVLGSGSSGNSTVVRLNGQGAVRHVLIDAGLSPRQTAKRLAPLDLALADISDVVLTHLDSDHIAGGWRRGIIRHNIRLHIHHRHARAAARMGLSEDHISAFGECLALSERTQLRSVLLDHDELGTVGFVLEHDGARLGFATDLGQVCGRLLEHFTALDALAIESNYDPQMQLSSGRPASLKRRIMGGRGHLSNEQSLSAVLQIAGRSSALSHIALLHLSRQCNDPAIVRNLYRQRAPHLAERLTITCQHRPTPMIEVKPGFAQPEPIPLPMRQLTLF
jgi:phosphoribosyl 1,2-cyclic phosphodiesterase